MPQALAFLVIAAQAGALGTGLAAVGAAFLPGIIGIGISLGASYLSSIIFKPQQPKPEDVQTSVKNATAPRVRHYGRVKFSGPWVFADSYQGHFYKVIALGTGELDGIEEFWCDNTLVGLDVDGWATTYPYKPPGYPSFLRIRHRLGLATETYYDELEDVFVEWDNTHRGDGISSLFITQRPVNQEFISFQFPQLTQTNYRVVARTSKIYNPITATTEWTDNGAAVIRDYMTHLDGMRLPTSLFTTTNGTAGWLAAANKAALAIPLKAGGTEPQYRLWGSYGLNERPADVLARMLASTDGVLFPTPDGGYTLDIGYTAPTVTIDEDVICGFELSRGRDILSTANVIRATYMSPNHDYQSIDADQWIDDADVAIRGEIVNDTSFIMSPSHGQCRRLMKLAAHRANPSWIVSFQCNLLALAAYGHRFILVNYPLFGISNEVMEVKDFRFNISEDGILTGVSIEAQSMPATAYDWDAATEEGTEPINEEIDIDRTIPVPTNFAGTIVTTTTGAGTTRYALLTFDNSTTDNLNPYLEGRAVGETSWRAIPVGLDATSAVSFPLDDLVEYEFRARNVSSTGRTSEWTDTITLPTVPSLDFSLTGNSQYLTTI